MSQRFYPRNAQSRRDAVAHNRYRGPDSPLSKADGLVLDPKQPYNSAALLTVRSVATVYEGTLASTGWTVGLQINNELEKWHATATNVKSEVVSGISSFGLALLVGSIARTSDKLVTLGIGPDAAYVGSAQANITMTVAAAGFQQRTNASEAVRILTVEPFSMSYTGPTSIGTGLMTGTTGIVAQPVFTLQNTLETFHTDLTATIVSSLFTGIPVIVASTGFNAARTVLTVTIVGSTTVSGNKFKLAFPVTSSFVLRKAAFDTGTLCVIA
jgi:hypothetical protein